MSESKPAPVETVPVTVAPGRSLVVSLSWHDAEGVKHGSGHVLHEGETVPVPAPMVPALRAEGIALP